MPVPKWMLPLMLGAVVVIAGCKSEKSRLEGLYAKAATPGSGRAAIGNELRSQWAAGKVTIVEAVVMANLKLDSPGGSAAVVLAGAVLDTIEVVQPDIESQTNEFFWIQTGTLAGKGAAVAFAAGDIPLARTLVLAGSDRWQTEAYWREHGAHDALASLVMHRSGESKEALERLRSRPELTAETQAAYDQIEREWRRSRGG